MIIKIFKDDEDRGYLKMIKELFKDGLNLALLMTGL